jgi:hypothetical protein
LAEAKVPSSSIQNYLVKWKTRNIIANWILAVAALVGGLFLLFLTFWFAYAIILILGQGASALWELFFNKKLVISHEVRLIASGLFLVLLFVQYFRTDPAYWSDLPRIRPVRHGSGDLDWTWLSLLYNPGASARVIADLLLCGPRVLVSTRGFVAKAAQLRKLDVGPCSNLLAFLLSSGQLVPYGELYGVGWEPSLEQLRNLEGVNFLEKGLTLSDDLKMELCGETAL